MKATVMLARFPGVLGGYEHHRSSEWIIETNLKCHQDERIGKVINWANGDTPITMNRNKCLEVAKHMDVDYLLMIDSDMWPDEPNPGCKPFWDTAFDWIYRRPQPAMIAAPYLGGGVEHNNVFIFRWRQKTDAGTGLKLDQFNREEAAERGGIEHVAALPTGLLLLDMRILERMTPPYFYYEWEGDGDPCPGCRWPTRGPEWKKASTEDVTFTRDASLAWSNVRDAGCYVLWDSWARHIKLCPIGKPQKTTIETVGRKFFDAAERGLGWNDHVRMVDVDFPKVNGQPPPEKSPEPWGGGVVETRGHQVLVDRTCMEKTIRDNYPEFFRPE